MIFGSKKTRHEIITLRTSPWMKKASNSETSMMLASDKLEKLREVYQEPLPAKY
jgi:hypothetical protein